MALEDLPPRHPGRRSDDPKGLIAKQWARVLASAILLLGGGSWGVTAYRAKQAAEPAYTKSEVDLIKQQLHSEIETVRGELKAANDLHAVYEAGVTKRLDRLDDKLERWFERARTR